MKKRIICLVLAFAAALGCLGLSAGAAEHRISCVAVNDTLPSELVNVTATYGGAMYVPYWLFTNYLNFSFIYSASDAQAYLYTPTEGLIFDLNTGKSTDDDGYVYYSQAILRNRTVYLPLSFVQAYFGSFAYSLITDDPYGDVVRISTGSEVLTDTEFMNAAKSLIQQYWQRSAPQSTETPAGPTPTPQPPVDNQHEGIVTRICFLGLPDDAVLNTLKAREAAACFFLTAEDVLSDPDRVRRIVCEGHSLGVYLVRDAEAEFAETASLIFEAARTPVVLALAAPDCDLSGAGEDMLLCDVELDFSGADTGGSYMSFAYGITGKLDTGFDSGNILLPPDIPARSLSLVLSYLSEEKFSIQLLREAP